MPANNGFTGHETATVVTPDSVRYHGTRVFHFDREEQTITLNTGGHATATTKRRMNQAAKHFGLNFRVFQEDFNWYVDVLPGRDHDCHIKNGPAFIEFDNTVTFPVPV